MIIEGRNVAYLHLRPFKFNFIYIDIYQWLVNDWSMRDNLISIHALQDKEKSPTTKSHSQDMGSSSTGSTSSGVKPPRSHEESTPPSLSPVVPSLLKMSSARTECHPMGSRNIKNLPPLLPISKTIIESNKEDGDNIYHFSLFGRSASTSDFRNLDAERMPKY